MTNDLYKNKLYLEVQKRWDAIGKNKPLAEMELELTVYKKMLDIFHVGKFYYFIFCPSLGEIEYASDTITDVLGITPDRFGISNLLESIHPDDLPYFVAFEDRVVDFKMNLPPDKLMKYKSRYNYRIRKKDGSYLNILQQAVTIQCDEDGAVLRNLIVHTDITDLLSDNQMRLSFIGLDGEPSFINYANSKQFIFDTSSLTTREQEILLLLAQNKTSLEIGKELFISPTTVKTHRRNILAKTDTSTTLELVLKAKEKGWI